MLDTLYSLFPDLKDVLSKGLLGNQFFVGTFSAMVIGGVMYTLRSIPRRIKGLFNWLFLSMFCVRSCENSYTYNAIVAFAHKHRSPWSARNYVLDGKYNLTPGFGTSFIKWQNHWIKINREIEDTKGHQVIERMVFTCWTRNKTVIKSLLKEASFVPPDNRINLFFSEGGSWLQTRKPKRGLSTVFANKGTIDTLNASFTRFGESEDWYAKRGIPYKLVMILYGEPGTGKTSLIHALASEHGYDLRYLSSLAALGRIAGLQGKNCVVIEDIDALGRLNRDKPAIEKASSESADLAASSENVSFSFHELLNTLDGLATPHGLVVIMTTNKIDDLDEAILRPGRVDVKLKIDFLQAEAMRDMFVAYYEEHQAEIDAWVARHGAQYVPVSGATLQNAFLTRTGPEAIEYLTSKLPSPKMRVLPALEHKAEAMAG